MIQKPRGNEVLTAMACTILQMDTYSNFRRFRITNIPLDKFPHRPVTTSETDPNILRSTPHSVYLFSVQSFKCSVAYVIASQGTFLKLRTVCVLN
jgi:hypothetical protein